MRTLFICFGVLSALAALPSCSPEGEKPKLSRAEREDRMQSFGTVTLPTEQPSWWHSGLVQQGGHRLPVLTQEVKLRAGDQFPYVQAIVARYGAKALTPDGGLHVAAEQAAEQAEVFVANNQLWRSHGLLYRASFSRAQAVAALGQGVDHTDSMREFYTQITSPLSAENAGGYNAEHVLTAEVPLTHRPLACRDVQCIGIVTYAVKLEAVQIWFQWASRADGTLQLSVMQFGPS